MRLLTYPAAEIPRGCLLAMVTIEEISIASLGDLFDRATPTTYDVASGRLRDNAIYRGLEDASYPLLTSLDRLGGIKPPHTKVHLEEHILRNFLRYSRPYLNQPHVSDWEFIVTAQHHGLPTRILDWTYSPLVAAHFATFKGDSNTDRVVWKLDWLKVHTHFNLPIYSVLDLNELLQQRGLASIWGLFRLEETHENAFVCNLEPPSIDARIVAQSAAFTLSSVKTRSLVDVLDKNGLTTAIKRFIIPASKVDYIRDQLDLCSVDERRLFPDLDGVAAEMQRYYSTSPKEKREVDPQRLA